MSRLTFSLYSRDGRARRGQLSFPRGTVQTPAFMPVGTYGSVKGVFPEQIRALGAEIILGTPSTCGCVRAWTSSGTTVVCTASASGTGRS